MKGSHLQHPVCHVLMICLMLAEAMSPLLQAWAVCCREPWGNKRHHTWRIGGWREERNREGWVLNQVQANRIFVSGRLGCEWKAGL